MLFVIRLKPEHTCTCFCVVGCQLCSVINVCQHATPPLPRRLLLYSHYFPVCELRLRVRIRYNVKLMETEKYNVNNVKMSEECEAFSFTARKDPEIQCR